MQPGRFPSCFFVFCRGFHVQDFIKGFALYSLFLTCLALELLSV